MKTANMIAALALTAGLATAGTAVINIGNIAVGSAAPFQLDLNGAGIAAGTYTSYSLTADWVAGGGNPWSNESIFALTDDSDLGIATFYADPGAAPNSAGNGNAVTLNWNGFLDVNYNGGSPLWFSALQTFGGSNATWNNVTLTLGMDTIQPPESVALGTNPSSMTSLPIAAGEVQWFEFSVAGGAGAQPWSITTAGSTNTGGSFGDDDTEIGLYDSNGVLIATNDDEDFGNDILTSLLNSSGVGALADGTYYIAVGNFNTEFGAAFGASSTSTAVGTTKLTVSFVPAPSAAALLGLGGLAAIRRRR